MIFQRLRLMIAAIAATLATLNGGTVLLDPAETAAHWKIFPGPEFPGATGEIFPDPENGKLLFRAGFSGESRYVAAVYTPALPEDVEMFYFRVTADRPIDAAFRVVDAEGRAFQTVRTRLEPVKETRLPLNLRGPWAEKWGGKNETANPKYPLRQLQFIVNRGTDAAVTLRINGIEAEAPFLNEKPFTGDDFRFPAFGCDVAGVWTNGTTPKLKLTVSAPESFGEGACLALRFPDMYRDKVTRIQVRPGESVTHDYTAPLTLGGCAFNTYVIEVSLERDGRTVAQAETRLRGADSPDWSRRLTTAEGNENSIIGTGVHFNQALKPGEGSVSWFDYETILKKLSAAGIKYIRDDFWPRRDDGTPGITPERLERLKAAKRYGFKVIAIIPTFADQTIEYFLEGVRGLVNDTRDYVAVYEIGNEPHNFGGWTTRYPGGSWNAKQPDNSTSRWLLEHVKYTQAAAKLIRELAPEAKIIGGGCVTSANIRYLQAGIPQELDGIVDHPYTTMMPPERLAFGSPFDGRDGVKAGGPNLTLPEVVDAYKEQFAKINRRDLSLYFTEFGYTTYVYNGKYELADYGFAAYTEQAQAAYITRRFLQCLTMPEIKAAVQYDALNDYGGNPFEPEANFGLLHADYSPKPSYFAIRNLATFFDGVKYTPALDQLVKIEAQPLQRAGKRDTLIDWEMNGKVLIQADNSLHAHLFETAGGLRLAVWSGQQYSEEFAKRTAVIRIRGRAASAGKTVGTDLITGKCFDVPSRTDNGDLIVKIAVGGNPITVTLF